MENTINNLVRIIMEYDREALNKVMQSLVKDIGRKGAEALFDEACNIVWSKLKEDGKSDTEALMFFAALASLIDDHLEENEN